jgi:heme/copper-type cytochrome/quinol oxidase subunit 3
MRLEEELDLKTQLAVADAKTKILAPVTQPKNFFIWIISDCIAFGSYLGAYLI